MVSKRRSNEGVLMAWWILSLLDQRLAAGSGCKCGIDTDRVSRPGCGRTCGGRGRRGRSLAGCGWMPMTSAVAS